MGEGRLWPLLTGEPATTSLPAGKDVKPAYPRNGRICIPRRHIPEQIWDEPDRPGSKMHLGQFAGSAMPLMWAHAEYIKVLRSAADGQVFDRIGIVAERYLGKPGQTDLEIWKPMRGCAQCPAGGALRIQTPSPFRARWTLDDWQTFQDIPSTLPVWAFTLSTSTYLVNRRRMFALPSSGLMRGVGKGGITTSKYSKMVRL